MQYDKYIRRRHYVAQDRQLEMSLDFCFRYGPMRQISLVGAVHEEAGGYCPDILDIIEKDPFLRITCPWGDMSCVRLDCRSLSNDGPILWIRPGEQMVPAADLKGSPSKRRRYIMHF